MAKLLRISDYLLLAAGSLGEFTEDVRLVGDLMPKIMETRYGFIPPNYKRNSYLSSVSKLLSTGEINRKLDPKGNPYLELTTKGRGKFKRRFPILSMQKKKWDGQFMIVIFDIEEKKRKARDGLRIKLRELGFGMLQESVWVSPYHFESDLREFVKEVKLEEDVFVLTARTLGVGNYRILIEKTWRLSQINEKYAAILEKLNEAKINKKALWGEYFAVAIKDPMLPIDLLPKDWKRDEVLTKLNSLALTKT